MGPLVSVLALSGILPPARPQDSNRATNRAPTVQTPKTMRAFLIPTTTGSKCLIPSGCLVPWNSEHRFSFLVAGLGISPACPFGFSSMVGEPGHNAELSKRSLLDSGQPCLDCLTFCTVPLALTSIQSCCIMGIMVAWDLMLRA